MLQFQPKPQTKPRNKNLEGAVFYDVESQKIFGLIAIEGQDRQIRAIVEGDRHHPVIRGGVDYDNCFLDLELRSVEATGNQPSWQGFLVNQGDPQDRFQISGWVNTTNRGVQYLRLKAKRLGMPRQRQQKAALDAWSLLTGQNKNQIALF